MDALTIIHPSTRSVFSITSTHWLYINRIFHTLFCIAIKANTVHFVYTICFPPQLVKHSRMLQTNKKHARTRNMQLEMGKLPANQTHNIFQNHREEENKNSRRSCICTRESWTACYARCSTTAVLLPIHIATIHTKIGAAYMHREQSHRAWYTLHAHIIYLYLMRTYE